MNWFARRRRRKMLQKGLRVLGPSLKERYGSSDTYTIGQVRTTMEEARLPIDFFVYGYAVFLQRENFDELKKEYGEDDDYEAVRQEIANLCFSGEINFTVKRALSYGGSSGNLGDAWFGHGGGGESGGAGDGGGGGGGD